MPNEKLIIVGSYEKSHHFRKYADYIKKIKPGNVEIKNWVSENDLADLYANCKGLITTSKDEDFGMNAVEAMASGKPVIAPNEGGYKETVTKETGILVDNIDENKLKEAIERLENPEKFKNACQMQARKFDIEIFNKRIKEIIYEG
jgi:glycosyltransferase involved in cell wall biosynthesis